MAASLLGCVSRVSALGESVGRSLLEVRQWVLNHGGPGYYDLVNLYNWVYSYTPGGNSAPSDPYQGGTGGGGG